MVQSKEFYKQYQDLYEKYRDLYGTNVSIFLKKGSFYEFYGQQEPTTQVYLNNAKEFMELLDVQIHVYPEDGPNGTTGFFGGIPEWTLDKWAGKLTKLGWTVVVVDEFKDARNTITRKVTKILSPGTHVECAEGSELFTIAALWMEAQQDGPPKYGTVAADFTTGAIYMYEGEATGTKHEWHTDELRHFYQVYSPREMLLGWRGLAPPDDEEIRRRFFLPNTVLQHVNISKESQGSLERSYVREEYLRSCLKPRTALPLRTWLHLSTDTTSMERALVVLLRYVEEHIPNLTNNLQPPTLWAPQKHLQVINNALQQLNLVGTQQGQQTVKDLFCRPQTAMGRRALQSRLCMPLADAQEIRKQHDDIAWCLDNLQTKTQQITQSLVCMFDVPRLHRSIVRGLCKATDMNQLHQSYEALNTAWDSAYGSPFSKQTEIPIYVKKCLQVFHEYFDIAKIKKTLKQDTLDELGFLKDTVAPNTAAAEIKIQEIYTKAQSWLQTLLEAANVETQGCYFKPTEKNVFAIHVTKVAQKQLKQYIDSQHVNPAYKKCSFKTYNSSYRLEHHFLDTCLDELDKAKAAFKRALEDEIVNVCTNYTQHTYTMWEPMERWVTHIDLAICMAKTAKQYGFVRPQIDDCDETCASGVLIENLRHPLIEIQKTKTRYVTHNVNLGYTEKPSWLLYGMNASGKSSLMKAIGLAVLLAQVGSYVPATAMRLRPFKKIATRILNQDNLWAGLSSFAVEMSELREIFQVADHQTLVLGDELCSGTESISATAIVAAGIQWLTKCASRFVLATHLHDLLKLDEIRTCSSLQVWHLHVEYDYATEKLIYHRDLRKGSGSTLYGLEVAKALHLPPDMLSLAHAYRHRLMEEKPIEERSSSRYNATIVRKKCEVCGCAIERDLEVHHVSPQEHARNGRNPDGTALHSTRNLAILCDTCHTKHHNQEIEIGSVQDTSEGPERMIQSLEQFQYTAPSRGRSKQTHTEEELANIRACIQKYQYLHPNLIAIQIKKDYEISITVAQLKRYMTSS